MDIDPRAAQIAALALWLRAQRAWQALGLAPADPRRRVERSNIVCAEPMPGERDLLEEFTGRLRPPVLGQLVATVFEQMRLAGEAGSLLEIEREIESAIRAARRQWAASAQVEFNEDVLGIKDPAALYDLTGVTDEAFWEGAERLIVEALKEYAERAAAGNGYERRLFADDAAQGFAFVDLCRQRFDVVLMNPPFGAASKGAKRYLARAYPRSKNDLLAAFVERGLAWLEPGALLGAITSRTAFFLTSFRRWREEVVLGEARPTVFADLGHGVMDAAMVEAAAYCLEKSR